MSTISSLRVGSTRSPATCRLLDNSDCGQLRHRHGRRWLLRDRQRRQRDSSTGGRGTFTDKSGNTTYLQGEFYEGGVNLSLLGLAGECFASVASETRSSTSTTATS